MKLSNWIFGLAIAGGFAAAGAAGAAGKLPAEDELFSAPTVLQLQIEIPQSRLDALRQDPKTYVKGTVREGNKAYVNAGIRLKGAASAQLLDKKPSMAIKFDEFVTGQRFHGHEKILLNNSLRDPTYLCEAIGGELFRAAGVPAAKVTFARVELNGRDAGLYVLAQAPNRDFLSDHFKKTKGNFYEGNQNDVTDKLRLDSGDGPKDQADVKNLASAARENDPAQRLTKLSEVLDLDRFVSFVAVEAFTWHRNGYALDRDNYRIYHDPAADRMVFIPDGLDGLFSKANGPLLPGSKGLVARAVLETPEGQRLCRERMAKLLATAFKVDTLQKRVNDLAGKIRPALTRDPKEAKAFDAAVTQLRETIAQRARVLEAELKQAAK